MNISASVVPRSQGQSLGVQFNATIYRIGNICGIEKIWPIHFQLKRKQQQLNSL